VAAPLLVADAVGVGQRGRHSHVSEELPEVGAVAGAAAAGPVRDGHDGGGARVAGSPPPLAVLPADGGRQPRPAAEFVDGPGLAVVVGVEHGAGALAGWQGCPYRIDGTDELGPADGVRRVGVRAGEGLAGAGEREHRQGQRQGHRREGRGDQQEVAQPGPPGLQPCVDGHGARGGQVDVGGGQVVEDQPRSAALPAARSQRAYPRAAVSPTTATRLVGHSSGYLATPRGHAENDVP
jgi:hypothetical protein